MTVDSDEFRIVVDGARHVLLNHKIRMRDLLRSPGYRELEAVLCDIRDHPGGTGGEGLGRMLPGV